MMNKRLKQGSTFLLAVALTFPLLTLPGAKAANAIDTDAECSIQFDIGGSSELLNAVQVNLYKVASVDESGNYTATGAFSKLDFSSVSADNLDTAAATWAERAKEAQGKLTDSEGNTVVDPTKTVTQKNGRFYQDKLETGLYLVDTPKVITPNYTYTFTPYLISLPTNNYYNNNHTNDDWIYNLTGSNAVSLKTEQHVRYGNLVINKELVDHNATFGNNATFVFQIDIKKPDEKKETRIEELTFNAAGSDSVTIEKIPAGSTVTVTEVYSGASYKLTSQNNVTATIVANDEKEAGQAGETAVVSFTNEHDGRTNGGYGVKNNFKLDETDQYQYTKPAATN
ncbi:DUF5979 domain-containing protein [Coprococcus comes]